MRKERTRKWMNEKKSLYMDMSIRTQQKIENLLNKKIAVYLDRIERESNLSKPLMNIYNKKQLKAKEKVEMIFYLGRLTGRGDIKADMEEEAKDEWVYRNSHYR